MRSGVEMSLRVAFLLLALISFYEGRSAALPNLTWRTESGFRVADLSFPLQGRAGFTLLASPETGIAFTNYLSEATVAKNRLTESGSGVALGDVDNDGRVDIYFCGLEGGNTLYQNLGSWRFQDITGQAGVACPGQLSTGCAFADLDGDNDLDLLVNSLGGGTRLFFNDGRARFTESKTEWPSPPFGRDFTRLGRCRWQRIP